MEYIVIKEFIERGTCNFFKAGEKYTCLDDKRAKFLINRGYLAAPPEESPKTPAEKPEKAEKAAKPQKATAKRSTRTKKA